MNKLIGSQRDSLVPRREGREHPILQLFTTQVIVSFNVQGMYFFVSKTSRYEMGGRW